MTDHTTHQFAAEDATRLYVVVRVGLSDIKELHHEFGRHEHVPKPEQVTRCSACAREVIDWFRRSVYFWWPVITGKP